MCATVVTEVALRFSTEAASCAGVRAIGWGAVVDDVSDDLAVHAPATSAVGAQAVRLSLKRAVSEMGVSRTLKTLSAMNQVDGFD